MRRRDAADNGQNDSGENAGEQLNQLPHCDLLHRVRQT
jgi:hypothetical protein